MVDGLNKVRSQCFQVGGRVWCGAADFFIVMSVIPKNSVWSRGKEGRETFVDD